MKKYLLVFFVMVSCCFVSMVRRSDAAVDLDKREEISKELEKLSSSAATLEESLALVAEYVKPSVVSLTTVKVFKHPARGFHGEKRGRDRFHEFFGREFDRHKQKPPKREFKTQSLGSGVIVEVDGKAGYILTNNHVVENMEELKVKLGDKREYDAEIIGTDPQTDLAVVKIEAENLTTAKMGDSDSMRPGQWAIAVGNPFGFSHTVSVGVISATGRSGVGIAQYENFLQTDAAINPGNSGGPLVNIKGEVVGINTAIFTRTGGYQGIGFAIPVNMAKAVLRDLINTGKVTRGWLGVVIQNLDPSLAKQFDVDITEGVLIGDVQDNSPAQEAGFKRADIVIGYGSKEIGDMNQLRNMVAQTAVGTEVEVKVMRDGKEKVLTVKIGEQPADMFAGGQSPVGKDLGLTVQELTEALAGSLGYEGESGVLVSSVEPGSEAAQADIKEGDLIKEVNREKISNVKEFTANLESSKKGNDILFLVRRGMHTRFVIIEGK